MSEESGDLASASWHRSSDEQVLFGVCAGVARRTNLDPNLLRILGVVASTGLEPLVLLYCFAGWWLPALPTRPGEGGAPTQTHRRIGLIAFWCVVGGVARSFSGFFSGFLSSFFSG